MTMRKRVAGIHRQQFSPAYVKRRGTMVTKPSTESQRGGVTQTDSQTKKQMMLKFD